MSVRSAVTEMTLPVAADDVDAAERIVDPDRAGRVDRELAHDAAARGEARAEELRR